MPKDTNDLPAPDDPANEPEPHVPKKPLAEAFEGICTGAQGLPGFLLAFADRDEEFYLRGNKTLGVRDLATGKNYRIKSLKGFPHFLKMMSHQDGIRYGDDFTRLEYKRLKLRIRYIRASGFREDIHPEWFFHLDRALTVLEEAEFDEALEETFRTEEDSHELTFMVNLADAEAVAFERAGYGGFADRVLPDEDDPYYANCDPKEAEAKNVFEVSTVASRNQVNRCIREMRRIFPGVVLDGPTFTKFTRKVEGGVITPHKIRFIVSYREDLKRMGATKRMLKYPRAFVNDFELLFAVARKKCSWSRETHEPWDRYAVEAILNRSVGLSVLHKISENNELEYLDDTEAPLWVLLVLLVRDKKTFVLQYIFDHPDVQRRLRNEMRDNPEIFRILRDQLKLVDLAKYLREDID